uniref:Uncharacterized protein n=1 Tax=Chromera velia CCMP2878 TaxID=1169474 RepID=A0A0G4I883_9ALVE|eukprot:Cvel_11795.t1-p1 / transcript=Cvel_11795.t1 / gene=Cvel_11795 / organism=Chromera_velia_CCMP2878 / gene_product=hypothetical protein / transcript_product=hypothetical protein / location=Cvel_scaffold750:44808-47153(-) / protein_length=782 / sequence_SO=supercontig / SO=protein_coding / is_pseudo=false
MSLFASVLASDQFPNLLSLNLSSNPLGPSGLKALSKGLSSSTDALPLQTLKLARTKAKAEGVGALAEALKAKKTTSLQTLDLAENEMRPAGVKHLASAVNAAALPHLRVLLLKENKLTLVDNRGQWDYAPIAELLSTHALKELEELGLSNNCVYVRDVEGGDGGVVISAADLAVPGRFPKLRRLDLGADLFSGMASSQLAAFATALGVEGAPRSVQELIIRGGGSPGTPEGVVALANSLTSGCLPQLTGLTMQYRGDATGEALVSLCRSLGGGRTSLKSLNLHPLGVLSEGVEALAEVIREGGLSSLENLSLDLRENSAHGDSVGRLGEALGGGGCPGLQKLTLGWNEAGDVGVAGVAKGLGEGGLSSLRSLSLSVRDRKGEGQIALGKVLCTGKIPSLRTLRLAWGCKESFVSLCEGIAQGRGISPPVLLDLYVSGAGEDSEESLRGFADVIGAGKLSGLQKLCLGAFVDTLGRAGWEALGEAVTHPQAALTSLEEFELRNVPIPQGVSAFLQGLSRGSAPLPALRSLKCPTCCSLSAEGAKSLGALLREGMFPCLKVLCSSMWDIGPGGMIPFASALCPPHISSLRVLDLTFGATGPESCTAEMGMLSLVISSGHLCRLEELSVMGLREEEEVRALCAGLQSGQLTSLRVLTLMKTEHDPLWDNFPLGDNALGADSGRAISEAVVAENFPRLRMLKVESMLNGKGVEALVEGWMNRQPPLLQFFGLKSSTLRDAEDEAVSKLFSLQKVPSLETVSLLFCTGLSVRSQSLLCAAFPDIVKF